MSEEPTKKPEDAAVEDVKETKDAAPAAETVEVDVKSEAAEANADAKDAGGEEGEDKRPSQPTAADLLSDDLGELKIRKAKGSKNVHTGIVTINATYNNTKVSFTDPGGNVISWSSAGKCNFRGSRKSTAYAAQVVTQDAGKVAMSHGMKEVSVKVKGAGMGRDSAVRALQSLGFHVTAIADTTPVQHGGCRQKKRRRV